jgi:thiamine-phosphate pyrophosphorylase
VSRLRSQPHLCLITRGEANLENFQTQKDQILATIRSAVDDGVDLVQIREKNLSAKLLFELASEVVRILESTRALVLVNDRADVAIAAGAHGVHLPRTSLPPSVVRKIFGSDLVIGVSTHTREAALAARDSGADFAVFGPVFETPGKGAPVGLGELRKVCGDASPFPILALGGVDEANVEEVFKAGASGIAAIRSLNEPESRRAIFKVAEEFRSILG